jgi:chromosome segregation ATPase
MNMEDEILKRLATKENLEKLATREELADVKKDVVKNGNAIEGLKKDISGLKEDVSVLKTDVSGLKEDVSVLKTDVSGLKKDVVELKKSNMRIAAQVAKNTEAIKKMVTRDEFNEFKKEMWSRLDKMMVILVRLDQERVIQNKRIDQLEEDMARVKAYIGLT